LRLDSYKVQTCLRHRVPKKQKKQSFKSTAVCCLAGFRVSLPPAVVQEIQRYCSIAGPLDTVVIIGGVLDFHLQCSSARAQGLIVERVYGSVASLRMVQASNSNWHTSFGDFLQHVGIPDWRTGAQDLVSVRFRNSMPKGVHAWLGCGNLPGQVQHHHESTLSASGK
jgi:hypothetical protein